jgi:transglutaminase-like putative cysteine protease
MDPDPSYLKKGDTRTMAVTYTAKVKDIPAGTKSLRVWVPVPQTTTVQEIRDLAFPGREPVLTREQKYGNLLAYYEVANPGPTFEATYSFTAARREVLVDTAKLPAGAAGADGDATSLTFLQPDRLVVVDDRIRAMAAEATKGRKTTMEKARAIYDFVAKRMTYDKSGTGWGRGDTNFACDVGKGNCTDFHALFMSLARAEGIATGFEIGLYGPYGRHSTEALGGYHCWSWFKVPGGTWVPVDISEADRFADRYEFLFGNQTANRIALAVGRDLVLEPRQAGEPLNYLLNPHAEADGKAVPTSKDWTLKDLDPK